MTRASGACASRIRTAASDAANDPAIAAHAMAPDKALLRRRPRPAFSRNPRNGKSGIRRSMQCNHEDTKTRKRKSSSPFQLREHVGVERLAVTEQCDDDREADRRLGGCYG